MSELCMPAKVLDQHLVVLGKTGAGKSSALRHVVEHLLGEEKRVCIVDPKGDWWGLKRSASGKSKGFPVITFGDFKNETMSDVPINRHAGKHIAELVASGNRPVVIGLRGWMPAAQSEFWIDFASTVFNSNACGGLNLFVDEIQNFAPKERTGFDQENLALHWTKRLLSEGRGLGLSIFCGSQRPQSVHNGVLTQCETLVAMRLIHDADCTAVESWLKRTRDKEKREEIMTSLPDLGRGEAWVWSPEAGFGPVRMKFPMFETFDSFAPQQLQKEVSSRNWADVDLDDVRAKLATVIEEAKANDPRELRREIARLKVELEKRHTEIKPAKVETKEVPALTDAQIARLEKFSDRMEALLVQQRDHFSKVWSDGVAALVPVSDAIAKVNQQKHGIPVFNGQGAEIFRAFPIPRPQVAKAVRPAAVHSPTGENAMITRPQQRILDSLMFFEQLGVRELKKGQLAGFADASPTSSSYGNNLGTLRSSGLIHYPRGDYAALTDAGRERAQPTTTISTLRDLHETWLRKLTGPQAAIVRTLIGIYPEALDKATLAEQCEASATSSSYGNNLGTLRTLGVIDYPQQGFAAATDLLFPPGLT